MNVSFYLWAVAHDGLEAGVELQNCLCVLRIVMCIAAL